MDTRHVGVRVQNDQIFVEHAILEGADLRQLLHWIGQVVARHQLEDRCRASVARSGREQEAHGLVGKGVRRPDNGGPSARKCLGTNAAVERADAGRSRPSGRRSSCTAPRRSCVTIHPERWTSLGGRNPASATPNVPACSVPRRVASRKLSTLCAALTVTSLGAVAVLSNSDRPTPESSADRRRAHRGRSRSTRSVRRLRMASAPTIEQEWSRLARVREYRHTSRPPRTSSRGRRTAEFRRRRYRCSTAQGDAGSDRRRRRGGRSAGPAPNVHRVIRPISAARQPRH